MTMTMTTTAATFPPSALWVPALGAESTVTVSAEAPARAVASEEGDPLLALGTVIYSIRLPGQPGHAECGRCGEHFRAAGPTGHANDEPICDLCLLECEQELGMVLALVSVTRAYVATKFMSPDEHWEGLEEVGVFAHIYDKVASRSGPARYFQKPSPKP